MTKANANERHDVLWRQSAKSEIEEAVCQANQAVKHLDGENDYFAQVHGHSALKMLADALSHIAAAVERRRTQERSKP